jgi:oligopeptidase B
MIISLSLDQRAYTTLIKSDEVPTYTAGEYKSERVFAKAKDGTKVPVSIVYKTSLFKKGENPLYVYSYGSYGHSTDTYFRSGVVSLLDRGFVFAIAHIRGGSEMGRSWYDDGKLLKKKNTFEDFIAATEFLIKKQYGKKDSVYAMGGSAGGLLMGAIFNMRPDLYKGVIAVVPFVDVVTTMLDDSIPLTTNEYDEWGNPNDKKFFKYILSYSPYDNVKKQNYTNLLITTGFHDSQVQYWEPAKWIAKLRANNTNSKNIMLMKTYMDAGHSGTTGRFESLKEDALEYAFILMLEGLK